jgi:hypothetical protein
MRRFADLLADGFFDLCSLLARSTARVRRLRGWR